MIQMLLSLNLVELSQEELGAEMAGGGSLAGKVVRLVGCVESCSILLRDAV